MPSVTQAHLHALVRTHPRSHARMHACARSHIYPPPPKKKKSKHTSTHTYTHTDRAYTQTRTHARDTRIHARTHTYTHTYARTHTYVTHARTQTHTHTHLLGCANRLQTVETILPTNNRKGVAEDDPKQFSVERGTKTQGCKNNLVIWLEKMGDVKSTACHSFANIEQLHPFTDRSIVTRGKTGTLLY